MNEVVLPATAWALCGGWNRDIAAETPTPAGAWILGRWAREMVLDWLPSGNKENNLLLLDHGLS